MTKALISVTGQDTTGIIARVATKLSELNINILDITQTILSGCFTMMMVVDLDGAQMEFWPPWMRRSSPSARKCT